MQSDAKVASQSTQVTTPDMSVIVALQLPSLGAVTSLHWAANPTCPSARSSPPPHWWSAPAHARQMRDTLLSSAWAMRVTALPSPGSGHALAWCPFSRPSQHFCRAFSRSRKNFVLAWPIER